MEINDDEDAAEVAQFAQSVAFVTTALAGVQRSDATMALDHLIEAWCGTEWKLSNLNVQDANVGLTEAEQGERDKAEKAFFDNLRGVVDTTKAKRLHAEFSGDAQGPAIRVTWEGCPNNGFGGGLILMVR